MRDFSSWIKKTPPTVLCVGPMSQNIVDVCLRFSETKRAPLVFVASRRQIEAKKFGPGYVNSWSTEDFAYYVRKNSPQHIWIARDHGGPGQGLVDHLVDENRAMEIAKRCFEDDIDAGLDFIHIDPSLPIKGVTPSAPVIYEYLCELYLHVHEYALKKGKKINIEVGTEEQNGLMGNKEDLIKFLGSFKHFCAESKLSMPQFLVVQTGTRVLMNKNVGVFETSDAHTRSELMRQIQELSRIALDFGIYIKEHNADYLSVENLNLRPKIGIKACNVAPEFAYHENKIILNYLKEYARKDYDHILDYIYTQKKWQKWVSSEAVYDLAFLATLAFHYHAHDVQVFPMVQRLSFLLEKRGVILKEELQKSTWQILEKYTGAFGYE